jgi:hypothetical protein
MDVSITGLASQEINSAKPPKPSRLKIPDLEALEASLKSIPAGSPASSSSLRPLIGTPHKIHHIEMLSEENEIDPHHNNPLLDSIVGELVRGVNEAKSPVHAKDWKRVLFLHLEKIISERFDCDGKKTPHIFPFHEVEVVERAYTQLLAISED